MLIYAHRGASSDFAEGSKAAYQGAIDQSADGFECDVRLTKDHQIICYHDRDTQRLSKINLEIAKTTFGELKERVNPYRLDELLDLAITNKKDLVIEFKHPVSSGGLVEKLTHKLLADKDLEIKRSGINISLLSFSFVATLRNIKSGYESVYLIKNRLLANINPAPIIGPSIKLIRENPEFVAGEIKKGKKVFVWTVNREADLQLCEKLGVNAVMSDNPALARNLLGYS
jgi:glycerophosphoryl diester phosphodiesterase